MSCVKRESLRYSQIYYNQYHKIRLYAAINYLYLLKASCYYLQAMRKAKLDLLWGSNFTDPKTFDSVTLYVKLPRISYQKSNPNNNSQIKKSILMSQNRTIATFSAQSFAWSKDKKVMYLKLQRSAEPWQRKTNDFNLTKIRTKIIIDHS